MKDKLIITVWFRTRDLNNSTFLMISRSISCLELYLGVSYKIKLKIATYISRAFQFKHMSQILGRSLNHFENDVEKEIIWRLTFLLPSSKYLKDLSHRIYFKRSGNITLYTLMYTEYLSSHQKVNNKTCKLLELTRDREQRMTFLKSFISISLSINVIITLEINFPHS